MHIESNSGQLCIWNRKTLGKNEYHINWKIPLHTHDYLNSKIKFPWRGYWDYGGIFKPKEVKDFSTKSLCELAAIILKNNFFEIGEEVYHQLLGTAIGTKFAPIYANLFMAGLEKKIFENANFKPLLWLRYLDDIFCIWTEVFERLQELYQYPTINFTMEFSKEQINFLDVKIFKKKFPYKQTYVISRQILTSSYILDLVIVIVTKSQSRMDRLYEWKEFVLMRKNYLHDLRI